MQEGLAERCAAGHRSRSGENERATFIQMVRLTIDVPESVLSALGEAPESFARELRLAAAVKWYELRRVSQGRAAEIAGISRAAFVEALGRHGVCAFQAPSGEVLEEARG